MFKRWKAYSVCYQFLSEKLVIEDLHLKLIR